MLCTVCAITGNCVAAVRLFSTRSRMVGGWRILFLDVLRIRALGCWIGRLLVRSGGGIPRLAGGNGPVARGIRSRGKCSGLCPGSLVFATILMILDVESVGSVPGKDFRRYCYCWLWKEEEMLEFVYERYAQRSAWTSNWLPDYQEQKIPYELFPIFYYY